MILHLVSRITDPDPLSIDSTFSSDNTSCDPTICNGTFGITVSGEILHTLYMESKGVIQDHLPVICAQEHTASQY